MKSKDQLLLEEAYKRVSETTDSNTFEEFVEKRQSGATKIAKAAESKGSYASLTAYHFKAKNVPYTDALKHKEQEDKTEYFQKKAFETLKKLENLSSLSQKEFQELTGVLEVYGEVYIQSITNKKYNTTKK